MAFRFRLLAEVDSPALGEMLGTLQMAGCTVLDCSLIAESPVANEKIVEHQAKPQAKPIAAPTGRSLPRNLGGPTDQARAIMLAFPAGHIFKQKDVYDKLRQMGVGESTARSAFVHALKHNHRVHKRPDGFYVVRTGNETKPPPKPKPKPAANKWRSTKEFVHAFVAGMKPGEEISRQQIMLVGRAEGQTNGSMNAIIYEAYSSGILERLGKGMYRKPHAAASPADIDVHLEQ